MQPLMQKASRAVLTILQLNYEVQARDQHTPERLVMLTTASLGCILFATWCADFTAVMSSANHKSISDSLFGLMEENNVILIGSAVAAETYLAASPPGSHAARAYALIRSNQADEPDVPITRLTLEPMTVYFGSKDHDPESLAAEVSSAFALAKDSEFLPAFNHFLLKLKQSGLLKRILEK